MGDVDDERLRVASAQAKDAFERPRVPAGSEVFDRRFLPPLADRQLRLK